MPQTRYRPEEIIAVLPWGRGPLRPGQEGTRGREGNRHQRGELLPLA